MTTFEDRPAPGRLELVRAFVNTRDIDEGTDALTSAQQLREWFAGKRLIEPDESLTKSDLAWATAVREAIRELLVANAAGRAPSAEATAVVNDASESCLLALRLDGEGRTAITTPRKGARRAIGTLLAVMHEELAAGRWMRLKACPEDSCHWAFYDTSRNHSSRWCHMGECGNRSKNRAYYARHRSATS
jgi:predicted RNA-binding Zn ribbon-like protein